MCSLFQIMSACSVLLLYVLLQVQGQSLAEDEEAKPIRLLIVGDPSTTRWDGYMQIVNNTREFYHFEDFELITPAGAKAANRDICASLDSGANFIISLASRAGVQKAVYQIAINTMIPTVQVDLKPWYYPRNPVATTTLRPLTSGDTAPQKMENTTDGSSLENATTTTSKPFTTEPPLPNNATNYVRVVLPEIVALSMLPDLFTDLALQNSVVLYDDHFLLAISRKFTADNTSLAMLDLAAEEGIERVPMKFNETDVHAQLTKLKARNFSNLILFSSAMSAANFVKYSTAEMSQNVFKKCTTGWLNMCAEITKVEGFRILFTTDVSTLTTQCDDCTRLDMYWVNPTTAPDLSTDLSKFKEFMRTTKEIQIQSLISLEDQFRAYFFFDLTSLASKYLTFVNETSGLYPSYACTNASFFLPDNMTLTLPQYMDETVMAGYFGEYDSYADGRYYQNVAMKIVRMSFIRDNRQTKQVINKLLAVAPEGRSEVGNWTSLDGITEIYQSRLDVDLKQIKTYSVAIIVQPPFIQRALDDEENWNGEYEGYCIELIDRISKSVGFNYTLHEVKDGQYGTLDENGEWTGLIRELIDGLAEIALAPLSVMAERENVVDFTVPYYDLVGTTILMRKEEKRGDLFKFLSVLEVEVWCCIIGAYFFTSFLLWIFDRFSPYSYTNNKDKYKDDPEKREFTLKECLWFCMTSLTPQGGGEAPKNISGRLVAATWWLFGFIIIASYTANLAAFLTVSRLETQISSLDDLAKQYKVNYAPVKGSASETYFRRMAEIEEKFYDIWKQMSLNETMSPQERAQLAVWDYPVSDKFSTMWQYMKDADPPKSTEEAVERVRDKENEFAFIGDATEIRYYAQVQFCEELMQVGQEFSRKPYAIAVQQMSDLKDNISSAILDMLNKRDLEHMKSKWWSRRPNDGQKCSNSDEESDGISIQNIGGVFVVILVGIVLSIITLVFEYWYYKDKRSTAGGMATEKHMEFNNNGIANGTAHRDARNVLQPVTQNAPVQNGFTRRPHELTGMRNSAVRPGD